MMQEAPMTATFPHLCELVEDATRGRTDIHKKRMFGCDAYFVGDAIFALIWKEGRIGVKLVDPAAYAELMAIEGAEPWSPGAMKMSKWVLVPEEFHDDAETLTPWVRRACQAQVGAPKKTAKTVAKKTAKSAAKKTAKAARA
jgi:TfoX/Sxy family transcriptional regulator of competence genes